MPTKLKIAASVAVLAVGMSGQALAGPGCIPGYVESNGVCQPAHPPAIRGPVSGAVQGEASGAARGNAAAGPVGAVIGGAAGMAAGTLSGTANMLSGSTTPACRSGYVYDRGGCYPRR